MLAEFVSNNKLLLLYELQKTGNWQGHVDFTEPCRLGHDIMLARIFTILQHFNLSTNFSYKAHPIPPRNLKVQEASGYQTSIPKISLQGKWVEDFGFLDLCQYVGQKKSKDYTVFLSSSSSFCCSVM